MMFFRQQGKGTDSKSPTNSPSDDDFLIVVIWDEGVKQFMLTHIWYGVCAPGRRQCPVVRTAAWNLDPKVTAWAQSCT